MRNDSDGAQDRGDKKNPVLETLDKANSLDGEPLVSGRVGECLEYAKG